MNAQERLRRQVSQLAEPGRDPYNSADRIQLELSQAPDFVQWLAEAPPADAAGDGHLRVRQAE